MTSPGRTGYSPLTMWMSVPQIVVVVTRIDGLADAGARLRDGLDADVARAVEHGRAHGAGVAGGGLRSLGDESHDWPPTEQTERRRGAARPG